MNKILNNIIGAIIIHDHELFVNELDVTRTLSVVNSIISVGHSDMRVGNCGWEDSPRTWFLRIKATDKEWDRIVKNLNVMRIWSVREIPTCIVNGVYSTD